MTTYTINEFATHVLKELGVIGAEETPTSADLEWTKEKAQSEIMFLNGIGIPVWNGSEISIPQEYLSALSRRVALAVGPSYGLGDGPSAQMAMREAEREGFPHAAAFEQARRRCGQTMQCGGCPASTSRWDKWLRHP